MQEHHSRQQRQRVRPEDPRAASLLAMHLQRELVAVRRLGGPATVVCVGTDRSTGDALGPLVGTLLTQSRGDLPFAVLGNLQAPVHAGNLHDLMPRLQVAATQGPVVAIDACLGSFESVGSVQVQRGPLKPGAGVRKELPPIGDVAVMATVNVGGFMEYVVLQNTRLGLVYDMAALIADALRLALGAVRAPGGAALPPP